MSAFAIAQGYADLRDPTLWRRANIRLIEKALSELCFEGLLTPEAGTADQDGFREFLLPLGEAGYRWRARLNRWGQPAIRPGSVVHARSNLPADDAVALLADVLAPLALPPLTLANYLRETLNTLAADTQMLAERRGLSAADWLALPADRLQGLLDGHPKAVPSKGRIGWSVDDNLRYGPERGQPFRLHWLAVHQTLARPLCAPGWDADRLLATGCDEGERSRLRQALAEAVLHPADFWLLPVHPWQWQSMIATQFAGAIADGLLVPLGEAGDRYVAQQSLRTLDNLDRPREPSVKLPVTILNTSAYRGLPARYLRITPALSEWLGKVVGADELLRERNTVALGEPATAFVPHPLYHRLEGAPYQFDEMLGAVWRDSAEFHRGANEQILMASVLQQLDDAGRPLAGELIRRSGLDAQTWLTRLFDLAVVPLYHLQAKHGLGFIAHGQNLMLRFRDGAPAGILLKDYQGDLFRSESEWAEPNGLAAEVWEALPTMPSHYLIHNLWTGLFASVFRFMATQLELAGLYGEDDFYLLLTARLRAYQAERPELAARFKELDPFQAVMPRLSLNRARFAAGYADTASRPIHALGPELKNPLVFAD